MVRSIGRVGIGLAAAVLVLTHAAAAWAVVVAANDDSVNRAAPASNPGWANMAHIANSSAVYLGNRWMITANHVGETPVRFTDGRVFDLSFDSDVRIFNTGSSASLGAADLRMFRLAEDPGLPTLSISTSSPKSGSEIMMIGAGQDRSNVPKSYLVTGQEPNLQWADAKLGRNNVLGFDVVSGGHMRWGLNKVMPGDPINIGGTLSYATRWDIYSGSFEAQATSGDSGGGVFQQENGKWDLDGLMFSAKPLSNQPPGTVVYGDFTYVADLSLYRDQILSVMNGAERFWQNQSNHFDVNGSGTASTQDAQLLINELLRNGSHSLDGKPGAGGLFYDVNGDGLINPTDIQRLMNALLLGQANPEPVAAPQVTLVPEPSAAISAVCGALVCGGAGLWLRRRRFFARVS